MRSHLTIVALATAPAPAGVAIVRVSGPASKALLDLVFKSSFFPTQEARKLFFGRIIDPLTNQTLDQGMAVFFKNPASFTGEDLFELHLHGSPVLAQKVLNVLLSHGATMAEPGEFTRRAFENGKIDLLQAEAVGDLIAASNEQAILIANQQLSGKFSNVVETIGEPLKDTLAEMEAHLDFPDEDIQPDRLDQMLFKLSEAKQKIQTILGTFDYGQVIKEGYKVLLCGLPNAGKSSLLNTLLGRERAIVTEISGTTRDLIEETSMIAGYQFVFCDSAGIAETKDSVEKIGIELALEKITWANLILLVVDSAIGLEANLPLIKILEERKANYWIIFNKIDLSPFGQAPATKNKFLAISTQSKKGISELQQELVATVKATNFDHSAGSMIITNERQKQAFQQCFNSLSQCEGLFQELAPLEIISAELRQAINFLSEIVGGVETEDLLGRIFSKFCIGK